MKYYVLTYNGVSIGQSGESTGSSYDLSSACPQCGTGAILVDNLIVKGLNKTKKDFFTTFDGDVIISKTVYESLKNAGLQLSKTSEVKDIKGNLLSFCNLNTEYYFPRASQESTGLIREDQCNKCGQNGHFNDIEIGDLEKNIKSFRRPVELQYDFISKNLLNQSDIFFSWEHMGISNLKAEGNKVIRYARPLLIVSGAFKEKFDQLKLKNVIFEEVFIKALKEDFLHQ